MVESWDETRRAHRDRQAASIAAGALALATRCGSPALTMAAIAKEAGISRQTLYRYFADVDAVLVGVAEFMASHDGDLERQTADQPDPTSQLDVIAHRVARQGGGHHSATALSAMLPPEGRDVLAEHGSRVRRLLSEVLQRGVDDGSFRSDLVPQTDAPLIIGLLTSADPTHPERAVSLVHRLIDPIAQHEVPTR